MRIMVSAQGGVGGHLFKVSRQLTAIMNHMYPCTPTYIGYFGDEPSPLSTPPPPPQPNKFGIHFPVINSNVLDQVVFFSVPDKREYLMIIKGYYF